MAYLVLNVIQPLRISL